MMTLLVSGLPGFPPEDANRDVRVDLKDAILLVKDFAKTAEEPDSFVLKAEMAIAALHTAAGLTPVIKSHTESKANALDFSFLIPSYKFSTDMNHVEKVDEILFSCKSVDIFPSSRYG
jgi:hypothetical protein